MGFFDEIAEQERQGVSLAIIENILKESYQTYLTTYKELVTSPSYSKVFNETKEKAFDDFKNFFISKGFNVSTMEQRNGEEGYRAYYGDFSMQFFYVGDGEFHSRIRDKEFERLTLEDQTGDTRLFQGTVHDDDIVMHKTVKDTDKLGVYGKAVEDIKQDIARLKKMIAKEYTPSFMYYLNERQLYVNSVAEYLDILNKRLKR
ncbi:hypothetical protein V7111_19360 [Neobacillus niacini]|uniref:hypothetical protein n=1 Tax=Neobacillus niacini TaxID=86668 RepID=UPI0030020E72